MNIVIVQFPSEFPLLKFNMKKESSISLVCFIVGSLRAISPQHTMSVTVHACYLLGIDSVFNVLLTYIDNFHLIITKLGNNSHIHHTFQSNEDISPLRIKMRLFHFTTFLSLLRVWHIFQQHISLRNINLIIPKLRYDLEDYQYNNFFQFHEDIPTFRIKSRQFKLFDMCFPGHKMFWHFTRLSIAHFNQKYFSDYNQTKKWLRQKSIPWYHQISRRYFYI